MLKLAKRAARQATKRIVSLLVNRRWFLRLLLPLLRQLVVSGPNQNEALREGGQGAPESKGKIVDVIRDMFKTDSGATLSMLEEHGIILMPAHYYCPVPTQAEIESSFEYEIDEPYGETVARIFDPDFLKEFLETLKPYSQDFSPLRQADPSNPIQFYWHNGVFSYCDAMTYYCMIRHVKPRHVLEVGSGFSSMVALEALERNGEGELICIEPYPRPELRELGSRLRLLEQPAQEVKPEFFRSTLTDGDILFIDSSHVIKTGGDVPHLYLRVIPQLPSKTYIHVHDIFLPDGYPKDWLTEHRYFYNEQYLLLAYLTDNPRAKVTWSTYFHRKNNHALLKEYMRGKGMVWGSALWFQLN